MSDHVYGLNEVREGIKAIVAEAGEDHVYSAPEQAGTCLYVHHRGHGVPPAGGCLIGRYLVSIDVPFSVLDSMDEKGTIEVCYEILSEAGYHFTTEAYRWMELVQRKQDIKTAWGEATRSADRSMELADA